MSTKIHGVCVRRGAGISFDVLSNFSKMHLFLMLEPLKVRQMAIFSTNIKFQSAVTHQIMVWEQNGNLQRVQNGTEHLFLLFEKIDFFLDYLTKNR